MPKLHGIIPPIATPIDARERPDEKALRRLVEYLLAAGTHALFVMGSTGEFALFTDEERKRAIEIVVDQVGGRVPVLAGCAAESTKKAIAQAAVATEAGAQMLVLTPTYYFPATQPDIIAHYRLFLREADLPTVVYNIPWCTGSSIQPETAEVLFDLPGVVGMKDSSDDFWLFQRLLIVRQSRKNGVLFQGSENNIAASLLMGADGGVLGIANVLPDLCVRLYQAAARRDLEKVRALNDKLQRVRRLYPLAPPRQILKYMLSLKGIGNGAAVQPAAPLPAAVKQQVRTVLRREGSLD